MIDVELGPMAFWLSIGIGVLSGALSVWVFRRFTHAEKFRTALNRVLAHLIEFRLFAGEPLLLLRAQRDLLTANGALLRQAAVPSLVLLLPFALVLAGGEAFFGRAPLKPGQATVVTATYDRQPTEGLPVLELIAPPGMKVETPPVRVQADREVSWRVRALTTMPGKMRPSYIRPMTDTAIASISIHYPRATVFGLSWLIWFLAGSLIGGGVVLFSWG